MKQLKIIGHRGAKGLAPENTLGGLQKALQHQVDMLEFDLRVTKDGVVVLHHDEELTDPADNRLRIREHAYKDLQAHQPDLARFEEILEKVDKKMPLVVEVKPGEPIKPIVEIIKSSRRDNISLASFSQQTLRELQKSLPNVPKIVIERWSGVRAHRRMKELGATTAFMNQRWLWWGFIRGFKSSGKQLYAYTLNDTRKARRWAKWGLAGAITDYPDRFEK